MCRVVHKALKRQLTANTEPDEDGAKEELSAANVGRIVNLMSNDSYNVAQCTSPRPMIRAFTLLLMRHKRVLGRLWRSRLCPY